MRFASVLFLIFGAAIAAVPLFVPKPHDDVFFGVLRAEDNTVEEWSSQGTLYNGGKTYTYTAKKQYILNEAGSIVAHEAAFHARDASGRTKIYRRTRYFDERGSPAEHVKESPTRTIMRGREPSEEGKYREEFLSDKTPLLVRPLVCVFAHGAGALIVICGLGLVVFRRRRIGRTCIFFIGPPPLYRNHARTRTMKFFDWLLGRKQGSGSSPLTAPSQADPLPSPCR